MKRERNCLLKLCMVVLTIAILLVPSMAMAQKGMGGVTGGARTRPGTWTNQRVSKGDQHGQNYSRDVYRQSREIYRNARGTGQVHASRC